MKHIYRLIKVFAVMSVLLFGTHKVNAQYPAAGEFDGYYSFTADLKLENNSYRQYFKDNYEFKIENTLYGITISDLIVPNMNTEYDEETGVLTITTNYGKFGNTNLGFADADATWTGMGTMYGTLLTWQIEEDGSITIPDFTIVDFSKYASNKTVTVVARYTNCRVEQIDDKEEEEEEAEPSFQGKYKFSVTQTEYEYGPDEDEKIVLMNTIVSKDYVLEFVINEYNQVWRFEDYTFDDMYLNTLRNRGFAKGDVYTMDVDTNNGVEWVYVLSDETAGSTDAKLFGGRNLQNWIQGQTAFTLRKNADETYTLSDFSLWQRTMEEIEGEGGVMNQQRTFRPIKYWTDIKYLGYSTSVDQIEEPSDGKIRYYNLQGIELRNPEKGSVVIKVEGNKASKVVFRQ